jgi:hypothetical protein
VCFIKSKSPADVYRLAFAFLRGVQSSKKTPGKKSEKTVFYPFKTGDNNISIGLPGESHNSLKIKRSIHKKAGGVLNNQRI